MSRNTTPSSLATELAIVLATVFSLSFALWSATGG